MLNGRSAASGAAPAARGLQGGVEGTRCSMQTHQHRRTLCKRVGTSSRRRRWRGTAAHRWLQKTLAGALSARPPQLSPNDISAPVLDAEVGRLLASPACAGVAAADAVVAAAARSRSAAAAAAFSRSAASAS